jgi:hypothetical protein
MAGVVVVAALAVAIPALASGQDRAAVPAAAARLLLCPGPTAPGGRQLFFVAPTTHTKSRHPSRRPVQADAHFKVTPAIRCVPPCGWIVTEPAGATGRARLTPPLTCEPRLVCVLAGADRARVFCHPIPRPWPRDRRSPHDRRDIPLYPDPVPDPVPQGAQRRHRRNRPVPTAPVPAPIPGSIGQRSPCGRRNTPLPPDPMPDPERRHPRRLDRQDRSDRLPGPADLPARRQRRRVGPSRAMCLRGGQRPERADRTDRDLPAHPDLSARTADDGSLDSARALRLPGDRRRQRNRRLIVRITPRRVRAPTHRPPRAATATLAAHP